MNKFELLIIEERVKNGIRVCLKSNKAHVITPTLIQEVRRFQQALIQKYLDAPWDGYLFVIWYAHRGHHFNGGLDFNYIHDCIVKNKPYKMNQYITNIFDMLFLNYIGLGLPIINCSIVEHIPRGFSQEFFSLNKVNFIRKNTLDSTQSNYSLVSIDSVTTHKVFPDFLYQKNQFYFYDHFDFSLMREILGQFNEPQLSFAQIHIIKEIFDKTKQQTLDSLHLRISKNPNLIKRAAWLQMHKDNTQGKDV